MAWTLVSPLRELRDQMNARFPNRDKSSDGVIGDTSHAARSSSHNPDRTGSPEYRDGDSADEVRACDFDADLRDPKGVTMEQVVQHLVTLARAGALPHLRYLIFNKRIWTRSNGFKTQVYTGANTHTQHVHINSEFNQSSDNATGVNWRLNEIGGGAVTPPASSTVLQQGATGEAVRRLQSFLRNVFPAYRNSVSYSRGVMLAIDGDFGRQTAAWVKEFQRRSGLTQDGIVGPATLAKLRAQGYRY